MNENYIMFLSKLVDENFDDINNLIEKVQSGRQSKGLQIVSGMVKSSAEAETQPEMKQQANEINGFFFGGEVDELVRHSGVDLKVAQAPISILNFNLKSLKVDWVFGQAFDEH